MANEFKVKKGLIVDGTNTVLDIQGTQGQLFSVTDSLTGDLFSVSDISGVPILNVNSSGLVTVDGNISLGDSDKIQFGASQDLQIYHDGLNSYIKDVGTGDLYIEGGNNIIFHDENQSRCIIINTSASVDLFYADVKKLETTNTGVAITGNLLPEADASRNLGTGSLRWNFAYINNALTVSDGNFNTNTSFKFNKGLIVEGSVDSVATDYGYYQRAGNNIILKGDASGRSGIFFESEKDGTNINDPSDYGFIQFHAYGYGNTTGEANNLVIGVANDSTDHVILQTPYNGGVKVGYVDATSGTGLTTQTVFHDAYHPNADVWTTARTITLSGDLTGSVSINGFANVTLTAAVVDDSHTHTAANINSGTLAAARLPAQLSSVGSSSDALGIYFRGSTEVVSGESWCTAHYAYNYNDGFLFLNRDSGNVATSIITLTRLDGAKSTGATYAGSGLSNTTYYTNIVKTTTKTEFKDAQGLHHFNSNVTLGGTLTATGDVVAYSDEKLKENVKTLDGSKVLKMRGVSFDRSDTGKFSSGVIAQELQKIAPELVLDNNGTLGVAYGNLAGYLIEAIKEQQKQINELKKLIKNGNNL